MAGITTIRLRQLAPSEVDEWRGSTLIGKDSPVVLRIDGEPDVQFVCGNCGTPLVLGDPLNAKWVIEESVRLRCSICWAYNSSEALRGRLEGRQLTEL